LHSESCKIFCQKNVFFVVGKYFLLFSRPWSISYWNSNKKFNVITRTEINVTFVILSNRSFTNETRSMFKSQTSIDQKELNFRSNSKKLVPLRKSHISILTKKRWTCFFKNLFKYTLRIKGTLGWELFFVIFWQPGVKGCLEPFLLLNKTFLNTLSCLNWEFAPFKEG